MGQYILDPQLVTAKGFNSICAINEKLQEGTDEWLHLTEIGGPKHLNSMEMAEAICTSGARKGF